MKRLFLVLFVLLIIGCAKPAEAGDLNKYGCDSYLGPVLNKCVGHPDQGLETAVGWGHDLEVWANEDPTPWVQTLNVEYRNDWQNGNQSVYFVTKSRLSDLLDNLKGLSNKEE